MSRPPDLCLALHGPTAACHELHAGAGSFGPAIAALARARAEGRRVFVASWLTRSSCRSLVQLVDRLAAEGVAGWVIGWPTVRVDGPPEALARASRVVPRLGIAVPHALRAAARARQRGLPTALVGLPTCTLGPFAALQAPGTPGGGRYPAGCDGCAARSQCPGVDPWYLDRFGAQELRPAAAVAATRRDPAITRGLEAAARLVEGSP